MLFMNIDTKVLYRILATGSLSFLNGSAGKEFACNAGDTGDTCSTPGLERSPGGGKWQPTPIFLPEKSNGRRSLAGYSLWGHKESDMTE